MSEFNKSFHDRKFLIVILVIKQVNMTSFIIRNRKSTITFAIMLKSCVFLVT